MPQTLALSHQTGGHARPEGVPQLGEEFYRALIESRQDITVVLDVDGTILYASPWAESASGYHPSELTGKSAADFVHPDSRCDLTALLEQSVSGRRSASRPPLISVRLKDNSFRSFEFTAEIFPSRSRPLGIVVTAYDATDLLAAERALRRREEGYRGLSKNMREGFAYCRMLYDTQGVPVDWIYLDANTAFERITGLANVEGRKVTEVIPGIRESNPELFEIYGRVAQDGQPAGFETRVESLGIWLDISVFCPSREHFVAVFEDITERKRVEAALRQGRSTLAQIMNSLPQAIFWKDRDGVYLGCNSAFARTAGVPSVDAIVGKTDFDLPWPRQEAEAYRADDRDVVEHNNPKLHIIEPIQQADGTRLWIDTSKVPLTDETGQVRGVLGVYEDITERKRAEEALRASEDRLCEAATLAQLGHWDYDVASDLFIFNDHIYSLLRTTAEQVGGYTLSSAQYIERFVHPDDIPIVGAALQKALENTDANYSSQLEHRVIYADGVTGHVHVRFVTTKDTAGRTIRVAGSAQDVSERKRAEEALRQSEEKYRTIVENAQEWVWEVDANGVYTYSSPLVEKVLGYTPDELVGKKHFYELFHPEDRESLKAAAFQAFGAKQPFIGFVNRNVRKDGGVAWLLTSGVPILDPDGTLRGYRGVDADITEMKRVEQERMLILRHQERLNDLQQALLSPGELTQKLKMITDTVVDIFGADFCRIWITDQGDLCELGCMHAAPTEGPHVCRQRDKCLRLMASSGRYTHTDDAAHRRVPFGAYKIGRIASGEEHRFLTNDVANDPRVHDHDWAKELGLVTFAGYQLRPPGGETLGVLALFSTRPITPDEDAQLDSIGMATARVIEADLAAEALKKSEEKFRRLVENLRDDYFFYRRDTKGAFSYVSPSIVNILGYSVDEFLTRYEEHLTGDPLNRATESELTPSAQGIRQPSFEVEICDKSGMTRYLEVSESPVCDDRGTVIVVEGIAHDITVRRQGDRALLESREKEQFLADVLATSAQPFVVSYPNGRIGAVNVAFCDLTGYTFMELQKIDWATQLTPPEWRQREAGRLAELDQSGTPQRYEKEYIRKDGSRVPVEVFSHRGLGSSGDLLHYYAFVSDITERKRAEKELARLAAAVEQIIDLVVITGVDGVIQYVNPAFERVTGYTREEAIGQTPRILKSGIQDAAFYHTLWQKIKGGDVWTGRIMNRKKDGTLCDHDVTITPVRDETGAIINFVSVQRDVTQSMLLEAQLRQAQKLEAVGSLAAGIAHEINTPIQFVGDNVRFLSDSFAALKHLLAHAESLKKAAQNRPEMSACVRELSEAQEAADLDYLKAEIPKAIDQTLDGVARVATIVRAMKDFSHPDQGQKAPADLNRALESTLTVARNELKYVADVVMDFDEGLPYVWCHLSDLNQVFLNLLVNAAHAIAGVVGDGSNGRGRIKVTTRRAENPSEPGQIDGVVISISDTGTGIPEGIRDRVFEQFFTTKEVGRGTGQGLAIARAVVVDRHQGQIWYTTEIGKGTTFHIHLPIGAEESREGT